MTNLIMNLTSTLEKLDVGNGTATRPVQKGMKINPNQFRRPFQPQQILQRDQRENEDKRVEPPLMNNFVDDEQ